jgi:hypothetical protein
MFPPEIGFLIGAQTGFRRGMPGKPIQREIT